jgi:hypothetical protein
VVAAALVAGLLGATLVAPAGAAEEVSPVPLTGGLGDQAACSSAGFGAALALGGAGAGAGAQADLAAQAPAAVTLYFNHLPEGVPAVRRGARNGGFTFISGGSAFAGLTAHYFLTVDSPAAQDFMQRHNLAAHHLQVTGGAAGGIEGESLPAGARLALQERFCVPQAPEVPAAALYPALGAAALAAVVWHRRRRIAPLPVPANDGR